MHYQQKPHQSSASVTDFLDTVGTLKPRGGGGGGGGGIPFKKDRVLIIPFRVLGGLVPLNVYSLKRSTAGAFAVPFMVLS